MAATAKMVALPTKFCHKCDSGILFSSQFQRLPFSIVRFSKGGVTTKALFNPEQLTQAHDVAKVLQLNLAEITQNPVVQDAVAPLTSAVAEVSQESVTQTVEFVKQQDWLTGFADLLEAILKGIESALVAINVPYAYGFSIILLTLVIKIVTYPATKVQVESSLAMQALAPKIEAVKKKYPNDAERQQTETQRLYQQAGVNPLAGCLPALATIPIFLGLYRTLSNVAGEGELTDGFFWIPSLAGPTSLAAREGGSGLSWLFPLVDGHPPIGWDNALAYLVLPVLLLASQYLSMKTLQPATPQASQSATPPWLLVFLPFITAFFSLSVPSGLSLYWFVNNVFSTAQQIYLRKLGGAKTKDAVVTQIIDAGQAKRGPASIVVTSEEREAREAQFRALKEKEKARKAGKKAAEEAARASSAKVEADRARLADQSSAASGESEEEDDEEGAEQQSEGATASSNGSVQGTKKSRRSKRTRRG